MALFKIRRDAAKAKLEGRDRQLQYYEKSVSVYSQVALAWVRKSIKRPLHTMNTDYDQCLAFDHNSVASLDVSVDAKKEQEYRLMLVNNRVKWIITDLVANTNMEIVPAALVTFVADLCKPKAYVPENFLTGYQSNRLDTDMYGAIISLDPN